VLFLLDNLLRLCNTHAINGNANGGNAVTNATKICPDCKSDRVQEALLVWFQVNFDQRMEEIGGDVPGFGFFCEKCGEEKQYLETAPIKNGALGGGKA
jgi:hypothetical protein